MNIPFLFSLLFLLIVSGCTHGVQVDELSEEINRHEARSLAEIRAELKIILEAHPDLSKEVQDGITQTVEKGLAKHQVLRDQESKVIHHILSQAVSPISEKEGTIAQKDILRKIYLEKSDNVFELVMDVKKLVGPSPKDGIDQEMKLLIREIR